MSLVSLGRKRWKLESCESWLSWENWLWLADSWFASCLLRMENWVSIRWSARSERRAAFLKSAISVLECGEGGLGRESGGWP